MLKSCALSLALIILCSSAGTAQIQNPDFVWTVGSATVFEGLDASPLFSVSVVADHAVDPQTIIGGWSFGVCHDASTLAIVTAAPTQYVLDLNLPVSLGFISEDLIPGQGYSQGVIIDFFGGNNLPDGTGIQIADLTYEALSFPLADADPVETDLCFCDTIGNPPVVTLIAWNGTVGTIQTQVCGSITLIGGTAILRGDVNDDGTFNLADPVTLISHLFPTGVPAVLNCDDAADTNVDETLTLADVIAMLDSLFGLTPSPLPGPYPDCGPAQTTIGCNHFDSCP